MFILTNKIKKIESNNYELYLISIIAIVAIVTLIINANNKIRLDNKENIASQAINSIEKTKYGTYNEVSTELKELKDNKYTFTVSGYVESGSAESFDYFYESLIKEIEEFINSNNIKDCNNVLLSNKQKVDFINELDNYKTDYFNSLYLNKISEFITSEDNLNTAQLNSNINRLNYIFPSEIIENQFEPLEELRQGCNSTNYCPEGQNCIAGICVIDPLYCWPSCSSNQQCVFGACVPLPQCDNCGGGNLQYDLHCLGSMCVSGDINVGGCIIEGSSILLSDNNYKLIEDINIGDKILSYNFETNSLEEDEVVSTSRNGPKDYLIINSDLKLTQDHVIFEKTKGEIKAKELEINDQLLNLKNNWVKVKTIEKIKNNQLFIYDLTIKNNYNYFVNNYLVHNNWNWMGITTPTINHISASITVHF